MEQLLAHCIRNEHISILADDCIEANDRVMEFEFQTWSAQKINKRKSRLSPVIYFDIK